VVAELLFNLYYYYTFLLSLSTCSNEDGLSIDYVIDDFIDCGLFKSRAEASHFLTSIDTDGNGSISCEEFMDGLSSVSNLHQVVMFKTFIKKLSFGESQSWGNTSLPLLNSSGSNRPSTGGSMSRSSSMGSRPNTVGRRGKKMGRTV
jgi:hypothetical protein